MLRCTCPSKTTKACLSLFINNLRALLHRWIQLSGCNPLHTSNNRLPQTSKRLSPAGGEIDHETEQLLIRNRQGKYSPRERKLHVAIPLPEPDATVSNQSQGDECYHEPVVWEVARLGHSYSSRVAFRSQAGCHIFRMSSSGEGCSGVPWSFWTRGASYFGAVVGRWSLVVSKLWFDGMNIYPANDQPRTTDD